MNKIFTQLLESRGFNESFLYPSYTNLTDPNLMPDLDKAISRIKQAIQKGEKVLIYGDYDVDGITASTIMEDALRLAGIKEIEIMLPDRFLDGYGMSRRLIERAKDIGANLVITVDCGSRNHEIVAELNNIGIDTIITDHHECADSLPSAVAIVNPKRTDRKVKPTLKDLAGVGVAFKVAQGLVQQGLIPNGQEKWMLDLVLIGTLCDSMVLSDENRILCYYGLKVLAKTKRLGLRELMRTANVKSITSESIGFQIGPRLNASGRLRTADLSLDLLRSKSAARASSLALKLEELNNERRLKQHAADSEIAHRPHSKDPVMVEIGDWHEGILGIVAGHLVEEYHKPAFVLAPVGNGICKGSGRSFGDFNLAQALSAASDVIIGGGGHSGAAGVQILESNVDVFRKKINDYYNSLNLVEQEKYFDSHADIALTSLTDFTLELLDDLRLLEPFGIGNEEPVFKIKNTKIIETKRIGANKQHLEIDIMDMNGKTLKCLAFSAPEEWFSLDQNSQCDFIVRPLENEWGGIRSIEARICDIIIL